MSSKRDSNGEAVAELPLKINIFIIRQPYTKLSYCDGWTSKPIGFVFKERSVNLFKRTSTKKRTTVRNCCSSKQSLSVTDYRTIVEDFYKVVEFVEWLKEYYPEKITQFSYSK